MSKQRRRYKVALAVERICEASNFLELHLPRVILSSQERRHFERILKELRKVANNSNASSAWINAELFEGLLEVLLRVYKSNDESKEM